MEALLGKGGMGAVYRARHILLGDRVAIKVLPPEVRTNAEWLRRFRREGQAARRFRHPNAVTVYDLRTAADGTIYMVMEYVEGHTLDHEVKTRGKFTAKEALDVLTPIMSVLETAHAMGVVHRDLKPENIMVGKPAENGEPVVKLLDLGIAKMREIAGSDNGGNTALTMAGQVLGTPYYMSPEQWGEILRDQSIEIDGRADIYSLGLVFYEMILGRRCFSGNTLHELRREHVNTRPRPLHELVADIPRGFSEAIERSTAKDRGDRQATARVLADELRAGLATPSGSTAPVAGQPRDLTETVAGDNRVITNADVNAATILTADATPTSPVGRVVPNHGTVYEPAKSQPAPPSQDVSATVVESAAMASSVTVPQVQTPAPSVPVKAPTVAPVVAPAPKSKAGLVIGVVVVFVILLVAGVGEQIPPELLDGEAVEGLVVIERLDDVIAVHPHEALVVAVVVVACRFDQTVAARSLIPFGGDPTRDVGNTESVAVRTPGVSGGVRLITDRDGPGVVRVQHVLATDDLVAGSAATIDMAGTTDHPALLVTLAPAR